MHPMRLSELQGDLKIEMIETSLGCPEACLHCGAYQNYAREDIVVRSVGMRRLQEYLEQVTSTGVALMSMLNRYITTHVNTEPLRTDTFPDFARLVCDLSVGRSQVVAISHGVRAGNKNMRRQLEEIGMLVRTGVIPLFILTVDLARSRARISEQVNKTSYRETLEVLREIIPCSSLTISIQGTDDDTSPLYIERARQMFEDVLDKLIFTAAERAALTIECRSYSNVGRAKALHMESSQDCDVIPDSRFVRDQLPQDHAWRGMIRFDGRLVAQRNRPGKTYGDSVNEVLWNEVV